ncbi:MAG TPA: DUF2141 domain-containing protein [Gammaproteobacteria bacterium]|nr:DUF2141 domain-containing protein [Gammaproteobacteria bacterium]
MNAGTKTALIAALLVASLPLAAWADAAAGGDIAVTVSTLRNLRGHIICALFDSAEAFDKRLPAMKVSVDPATPSANCVFHGVKPGTYAVTVVHDENDDGKLDTNFFGMPKEGYGVSNNHTYAMHGPVFSESRFAFPGSDNLNLAIDLRYP